jgi:glutaredoxin
MFVMSYCPYGNQAEAGLVPVIQLLGDTATFEPVYIVYSSGSECADNNGTKYCSLHGNAELWQDVREKIIFGMYGEKKWAEYVGRADTECALTNIDTCWATVADETGVNKTAVMAEFEADKFTILASEMEKTNQNGVSGSPTIKINGVTFNGGRTAQAYKDAICGAYTTSPAECGQNVSSTTTTVASGSCGS